MRVITFCGILFSFLLCELVGAQDVDYIYPNVCPEISTQPDLDLTKHQGKWYDWRYSKENADYYKCSEHSYTPMRDGPQDLKLIISSRVLLNNNSEVREGALFRVQSTSNPPGTSLSLLDQHYHSAIFYILETDYDNYAVEYACYDFNGRKSEHVWILSRGKDLPEDLGMKAIDALKRNNVDVEIVDVDQSCKEFYT